MNICAGLVLQHGRTLTHLAVAEAADALERLDQGLFTRDLAELQVHGARRLLEGGAGAFSTLLREGGCFEELTSLETAREQARVRIDCVAETVRLFAGAQQDGA